MPDCQYPKPPGLMGKRVAQQAADADLLVRMLSRLVWLTMNDYDEDDDVLDILAAGKAIPVHDAWRTGKAYVDAMHGSAHGSRSDRGRLPSLTALSQWRETATWMTSNLATSDPEWYAKLWSEAFASGYNVPAQVRRQLRV